MKKTILTIILLLSSLQQSFAHSDFYITKTFGNITMMITTGHEYEEISKSYIISELAEKLCKKLNYKKPVFLYFSHTYMDTTNNPSFYISYDKAKTKRINQGGNKDECTEYMNKNAIVIRQFAWRFDATATLKLLEYAISFRHNIEEHQKDTDNKKSDLRFLSIGAESINKILFTAPSQVITETLKIRIYRNEKNFTEGISYYWENEQYHLFYRFYNKDDIYLKTLDYVYHLERFDKQKSIVFDSYSTFYYQWDWPKPTFSKQQKIAAPCHNYDIKFISSSKISLSYYKRTNEGGTQPRNKTLLYLIDRDYLIQDLDEIINNYIPEITDKNP